jgi:uncharacterized membrane protein
MGTAKKTRYGFIDLLRGLALLVMIEAHVVNSYSAPLLGTETSFFWISFVNGLVAPAFLFASGFSLMLQASRDWEAWLHFQRPFWKQMRRLGFIALVAYYTHLQYFGLSRYLHPSDPRIWEKTLRVDILQCIVASLLIVELLVLLLRKRTLLIWALALLGVAIAWATPWIWAQDFRPRLPLSMALFLNPHGLSLFPIFPWACFALAGSFVAQLFLEFKSAGKDEFFMRTLLFAGCGMILAGVLLRLAPYTIPGHVYYYTTSPLYVVLRLGCVLIILWSLYALEKYRKWAPDAIRVAGQESLLIYGVHLWVVFGVFRGKHLGPILGLQGGYGRSFAISALVIVLMVLLAKLWHWLKTDHFRPTKIAQAITVTVMIIVFLLR